MLVPIVIVVIGIFAIDYHLSFVTTSRTISPRTLVGPTIASLSAASPPTAPPAPWAVVLCARPAFISAWTTLVVARRAFFMRHAAQGAHVGVAQIHPSATAQAAWQDHRAIANANESTHRMAYRFKQFAHFAIAAFVDDDAVPVVHTFAAAVLNALECGGLAVDLNPFEQTRTRSRIQHAQRAHRIFALNAKARMHQAVGQLT